MKQPIITILDRLTEKIQNENKIENVQIGLFRLEVADFSEKVFQEALLNALSHRDYQQMGAVYVKHYPDKIVIENPGGFLHKLDIIMLCQNVLDIIRADKPGCTGYEISLH